MNPNTPRDAGAPLQQGTFASFAARRAAQLTSEDLPYSLKVASVVLRAIFIVALVIVTARVSVPPIPDAGWGNMPTGDIARVTIGAVFALCMLRQLFRFPRDPGAHRTWLYLGLALAPLSLICLVAIG